MKKLTRILVLTTVLILVVAVGVAAAQGRGNRVQPTTPNNYSNIDSSTMRGQGGRWGNQSGTPMQQGGAGQIFGYETGMGYDLPPAFEGELPAEAIDLMIAGWLDEQHAYAAYESIMDQFGEVRPFVNIQQAEAQHAAAWELLFDRYGIETPELPEFDIPQFASVTEACALGAEAEIANFSLYDEMLEAFAPYPDLYQVAQSLRDASEFQHLPAFESCAG